MAGTLSGFKDSLGTGNPRVARGAQPWAKLLNALGVQNRAEPPNAVSVQNRAWLLGAVGVQNLNAVAIQSC